MWKIHQGEWEKAWFQHGQIENFLLLFTTAKYHKYYGCCGIVEKSLDDSGACGAKLFMGSIKQESSTGPPSEPWAYQAGDSSDDDGRKATVTGLCSWVQHIHRTAVRIVHCFDFSVKSTGTGRGLSSSIWLALRRDWLLSVGFTRLMLQTCTWVMLFSIYDWKMKQENAFFFPFKRLQASHWSSSMAVFSCFKLPKILQDFPSHRMFGRMHRTLNIGKKITNFIVRCKITRRIFRTKVVRDWILFVK
jgi:hypothetical protein